MGQSLRNKGLASSEASSAHHELVCASSGNAGRGQGQAEVSEDGFRLGRVMGQEAGSDRGAGTQAVHQTSGKGWGPAMTDSCGLERRHLAWGSRGGLERFQPRLCPRL